MGAALLGLCLGVCVGLAPTLPLTHQPRALPTARSPPRRHSSPLMRRLPPPPPPRSGPQFRLGDIVEALPTLPTVPTSVDDLRSRVGDALSAIRPLQVLFGFGLAVTLITGAVSTVGGAVQGFLEEEGLFPVIERTALFGFILGDIKTAYVEKDRPPTHFSHMSHPTFPISHILIWILEVLAIAPHSPHT